MLGSDNSVVIPHEQHQLLETGDLFLEFLVLTWLLVVEVRKHEGMSKVIRKVCEYSEILSGSNRVLDNI